MEKNTIKFVKTSVLSLVTVILLIGLDQFTKYLAVLKLKNNTLVIVQNVFELFYLENKGAAFGILQGQKWLFLVMTGVVLLGIVYVYLKIPEEKKYMLLRVTILLFGAGAVGNMIDRAVNQFVVDFFYFKLIDFPVFNVADCYVTVGSILFLFSVLFYYKDKDFYFISGKTE